jgi:hypothetical protein
MHLTLPMFHQNVIVCDIQSDFKLLSVAYKFQTANHKIKLCNSESFITCGTNTDCEIAEQIQHTP